MRKTSRYVLLLSLIFLSFALRGQNVFYHLLGLNRLPNFTWVGNGADANWSTAGNWSNNAVPGVGDTAIFIGAAACVANCSPTIDSSISVAGVDIQATYGGAITQDPGFTVTIGSAGWTQAAGTFNGGDSNMTVNGIFTLSGGTFISTSAQFLVTSGFNHTAGTYTHNSGLLRFDNNGIVAGNSTIQVTLPGAVTLNNLQYSGGYAASNDSYTVNIAAGSFNVTGQFTVGLTVGGATGAILATGGTINLKGNLIVGPAQTVNANIVATATSLVMDGAAPQTYDATGGRVPHLVINNATGVTPTVGTTSMVVQSFNLMAGSFTGPPTTFTVLGDFTYPAGTTYNDNGGSLVFTKYNFNLAQSSTISLAAVINTANLTFGGGVSGSVTTTTWTLAGVAPNIVASGNLTIGNTNAGTGAINVNGGTINVSGNYNANAYSGSGTTAITIDGGAGQTYTKTGAGTNQAGTITVNKVGTFSLATSATFNGPSQDFTLSGGIINLMGFALSVTDTLTVASGTRLICGVGGTVAAATFVINGEISCGTSAGITWTGLAGDNLWTTAGNWTNNTIPGAADVAIFNGNCAGANCNANIVSAVSVRGINIHSSYTGILTQTNGNTLTAGTAGFIQAGGTFAGGDSQIQITALYSLTGGTFNSTSDTLRLSADWTSTAGTFNHQSGTVEFYGDINQTINSGTAIFNDVNVTKVTSNWRSLIITGTMSTTNLSLTSTGTGLYIDTGNIEVSGDLTVTGTVKAGSGAVHLVGAGAQTVTAVSSSVPRLTINKPGGTATFSGTLRIYYDMTYLAGGVDFTGSIIEIVGDANTTLNLGAMPTMDEFRISKATSAVRTITVTGILKTVVARFSHANFGVVVNGGDIEATGDLFFNSAYYLGGTSTIKVVGSGNQTITGIATSGIPSMEINSTGGIVTLAGTLSFIRNFSHLGGIVDAGSSLVNFGYNGWYNAQTFTVTPGSIQFNNVTFRGTNNVYTLTGTLIVNGALVLGDQSSSLGYINIGTIQANGNVTTSNYGYAGTALLQISGTGSQTITGNATSPLIETEIISTGGIVTLAGTITFSRGLKYSSGNVAAGASTVQFGYAGWYNNFSHNLDTNTMVFNNVTITGANRTFTLLSDMDISGNLTLGDTASSGTKLINGFKISTAGNVVFNNYGYNGTAGIEMKGATLTTLTIGTTASKMTGTITVNKTGAAQARIVAATNFNGAGQGVTVTSGVLDLDGYDLFIQDTLTVSVGGTVKCSGGSLTYSSLANTGIIDCPGYGSHQFDWTGAGGNTDWNTPGNWSGGVVPGPTDTPVFTDTICGVTCNVTVNVDPNVRGLWMIAPYTGTITQGIGVTMTIGRSGWKQPGGIFVGSNADVTVGKSLLITGGSFTSTSGVLTVLKNVTAEGAPNNDTVFDIAGSTFLPNGGTLRFNELNSTANSYTHRLNIPGGLTVSDAIFNSEGSGTGITTWQVNAAQTFSTTNSFNLGRVSGAANVAVGATTLEISGSANYTNGAFGGVVTQTLFNAAAPATITVSALAIVPLGAYTVSGNGGFTITGNLRSTGLLTIGNTSSGAVTMNGGTIDAQADVVFSNFGYAGTTGVNFTGAIASTLTVGGSASVPAGAVTINKTGAGSLALASDVLLNSAGQNLNVTSGILNLAGFNLTVANVTNIGFSGTINCNGGILTPGTLTAYGSIDCPAMQRRVFNYTGADQNFTVPAGVTSLTIKMWGAGGGGTLGSAGYGAGHASNGGGGGYATGTLAVTPAAVLTMIVGRGGEIGNSGASSEMYGGGGRRSQYGGAGGGRSAIRASGPVELITAAGGGGGGSSMSAGNNNNTGGGAGGGTTGLAGASVTYPAITGKGGTPSAGGAAGVGSGGTAFPGTQYVGGRAAVAVNAGGGGGGGYYGGGGADFISSTVVGGGGGGSSYINGVGVSGASTTAGSGTSQGEIADPENGGAGAGGAAGTAGTHGRIIISW